MRAGLSLLSAGEMETWRKATSKERAKMIEEAQERAYKQAREITPPPKPPKPAWQIALGQM